jgi:hypothetical protein
MPLVTYLTPDQIELRRVSDDPDVNELLQELRNLTNEEWLISHSFVTKKGGWFRFGYTTDHFTLLVGINSYEFQVINLCGDPFTTKQDVINFMQGYIACYMDMLKRRKV